MNQESKMEEMLNLMASSKEITPQGDNTSWPWNTLHLSKAERKGLSAEQIQSLRRTKWVDLMRTKEQDNGQQN